MWGASFATLSFSAKCNGSGTDSDGNTWTITSDGTESNFDNTKGIHYGTSSAQVKYIRLSTSGISGTITQVTVNASVGSGVTATAAVKVGTTDFTTGSPANTTVSLTSTAADYTFTGSASGDILVEITKPSKAAKAIYCKSVVVMYTTGSVVAVTSVALDEDEITLDEDQTQTLTATVLPDNATNKNVTWESDDEDVATVEDGVVTAVGAGDATITCKSVADPTKYAECAVHVNPSPYTKSTLIFTAACGGSGTADDYAEWTVTSDGTESAYDATKGIHYGTNSGEVQYIRLSTSDISGTISKVVVNASTASGVSATVSVTVGGDAFGGEAQSLTSSAAEYTFSGSATGEIVVLITKPSSATKAIYCKSIVVTYEADASAPSVTIDPTDISLATPDAANGTIDATYENITLASVTVGRYNDAECTEAFTGNWLTATLNGDKDIEYTIAANTGAARTAYIKLTAPASNGTSPDVVKIIEVSQAKAIPTYTSLDDVFAAAGSDETVKIIFDNCVITGKKDANTAYLTDKENMYGLVIFTTDHGFNVGDVLNGTVQTTLCKYQGNSELKGLNSSSEGLTVTTGGSVTARVVSDPSTLTGAHAGSVIKVTGSCTKETKSEKDYYYINGVQLYNTLYDYETPTENDQYNCTGVFLMFNSIKEIMPRNASDLDHIDVPTAVITFEDFNIEKGQNTTLAATVAPAAAASAEVTYSIVDGGEYVSLAGDVLTATEVGTAHIRATVADNLPNYYGATKDITVTVTAPDSRKTAVIDGITAVSGTLVTETAGTHKDKEYISYAAMKGNASNNPIIPSGKSFVRIYQNGGYLAINAVKGCLIDEVIVSIPNNCNSTTIAVGTVEENLPTTGGTSATAGNNFSTGTGLNSQNVYLVCLGSTSSTRLEVGAITVKYTGDPISVKSIALSGEYQTEFTKNATFSHEGVVVTATYTDDSQADVTTLAEFSDPDMSTIGQKEITVSYGGKSTSYNIEVVAATLTEIAISGTYPTRFNVGDEFSHAGMTVTATYSDSSEEDVTDDATFSGYDMSAGGIQTVTVEYGGQSAQYSIIVVPANTDVITAGDLAATSTTYTEFTGVTYLGTSAVYAGKTAKSSEGAIQVRTNKSEDGIVVTGQNGTKVVKSVAIDFATVPTSPKVLQVYGKHTAYTSAADLFNDEAKGDLIGTLGVDGSVDCTAANYEFIGIRSSDGAMYLASVMVTWGDAVIPPTVYTVTFNTDGGSTIDPVEVEEGQAVAKPADPTKDDYNFVEWQLNGVAYDFTAAVTANITLDAVWEPVTPPTPTADYTRQVNAGYYGTICLPNGGTIEGAAIFEISHKETGNIFFDEIVDGVMIAGRPYLFYPYSDASELKVYYTDNANAAAGNHNGLYGSYSETVLETNPNDGKYNYILYNNKYYLVNSTAYVGEYRAYIKLADVPNEPQQDPAPGRRRISMEVQGEQVATGISDIETGDQPVKVMIDGNLYIIRAGQMYDMTGSKVK